ncbi:WcaI family glycosyltransferase [Alphaproteobacteria bacterium KMM 3653]|uniref:WcaI family glycosyltransferase n=1 Tax=Harenicola maris TaxID=2841044 RepID=A0AAP2G8E2_9RHOB|nr:WcaI family glycosyltransferase [Harenicola maris]
MKFQILGINYAPEMISTAVYTTDLAEDLLRRGHEVNVVTAQPYFPDWRVMQGWPKYWYRREKRNGVDVVHCPLYVPQKPTGRSRLLHYATFAATSFFPMIWRAATRRPDIVFVPAPSLVSALTGWIAARLCGAKLWIHVQDFEVEAAFATKAISETGRLGRAARAFERWIFRRCDMASSISEPMVRKLVEKGMPESQTFEFRNWANLDKVKVLDAPSPQRENLGITTRNIALYSGNVAAKQGLEIIPQAARLLQDRDDLTFVICGEGPFLDELKEMSQDLTNIRFFPLQPLEVFSETLGMADIHLLPQIAGVSDLLLPSKLTNMLASGRPVVATVDPGTALAKEVLGAGTICPPGDAQAFATAITELLTDPDARNGMGKTARERALERWNKSAIIDRFVERAKEVTDNRFGRDTGSE